MARIIVAANSSWNLRNFRTGLIAALLRDGHEVITMSPDRDGIDVDGARLGHRCCAMDRSSSNPAKDLRYFYRLLRTLRRDRPDLFLGFTIKPNIYGAAACRMLGIPAIPNVSGLGTAFLGRPALQRAVLGLYRFAFRGAARVFFQNADDQQLFLDKRIVRPGQSTVLPGSGVDLSYFTPEELPPGDNFLLIARLLGDKGVREYVEAARMLRGTLPQARFGLLGDLDPDNRTAIGRDELATWIDEGAIDYLGSAADVRPHIRASTAVVLPSYREGLPRTLLEAAATGRPLIATDVPGCRQVVRDGITGYLCEPRNAPSLSAAMERMARTSHERRAQMGAAARKMAEAEFDEALVIDANLDAVRRFAGRDPAGAP